MIHVKTSRNFYMMQSGKLQDACDASDMLHTWCIARKRSDLLRLRKLVLPLPYPIIAAIFVPFHNPDSK